MKNEFELATSSVFYARYFLKPILKKKKNNTNNTFHHGWATVVRGKLRR